MKNPKKTKLVQSDSKTDTRMHASDARSGMHSRCPFLKAGAFSICAISQLQQLLRSPAVSAMLEDSMLLLTPSEAARRLSISVDTLDRQIRAGKFSPPRRIGRNVRIPVSDLEAYVKGLPVFELGWRGLSSHDPEEQAKFDQRCRESAAKQAEREPTVPSWVRASAQATEQAEIAKNQPRSGLGFAGSFQD